MSDKPRPTQVVSVSGLSQRVPADPELAVSEQQELEAAFAAFAAEYTNSGFSTVTLRKCFDAGVWHERQRLRQLAERWRNEPDVHGIRVACAGELTGDGK